jgi:hypothetical protein
VATHKIPIPITAYGTNAALERIDHTPNIQTYHSLIKDVAGELFGLVRVPENYANTPKIEAVILANATSGVTRLTLGTVCIANDAASLDPASFTDETAQDITVPGTAYNDKVVTFPTSGNLGSSANIAIGKLLIVRFQHNGTHANDTLAVNTLLAGLWFSYSDT